MADPATQKGEEQGRDPAADLTALDDDLKKLETWGKELDAHWGEWITEGELNYALVDGHQWTSEEKTRLDDQEKVAVTFNRVGPVVDAVAGSEILSRQQVTYAPRTLGDAGVNDVLTRGAEWIRDRTDAAGEESDAVRDTFICGLGYTETRTDYEVNPKGQIIIERGAPMKCLPDPRAKQKNAIDARYLRYRNEMSRDEFEEMYPDADATYEAEGQSRQNSNNARDDYDKDKKAKDANTVTVDLWQWYERVWIYIMPTLDGTSTAQFTQEQFDHLSDLAEAQGRQMPRYTKTRQRQYFEAIVTGCQWLQEPKPLPHKQFRFKFMTGKRDNRDGVWYGIVRAMEDPQKWANELYSMLLHIMRTNAKGGLVIEEGAVGGDGENPVADMKKFEESWAKSDAITKVANGALSENRIQPKVAPPIPASLGMLFQQSVEAIRETSGVSAEMMGLVETNQPGVLEHQRKQATFGILATFFDSFRRYRKFQGELLLPMMRDLGPDVLVRIVGEDGNAKNVQLAMDPAVEEYDVIVADAPSGPGQKERNWALIKEMLPLFVERMEPDVLLETLRHSPLPDAYVQKLSQMMAKAPPDQKAQMVEQLKLGMMQLAGQEKQAKIGETQAKAAEAGARAQATRAKTALSLVHPDPSPQVVA